MIVTTGEWSYRPNCSANQGVEVSVLFGESEEDNESGVKEVFLSGYEATVPVSVGGLLRKK